MEFRVQFQIVISFAYSLLKEIIETLLLLEL